MAPHESTHPEEGGHVEGGFANEGYEDDETTREAGKPSPDSEDYPDVKDPNVDYPEVEVKKFKSVELLDDVEPIKIDREGDNPDCGWFGIRPSFIQVCKT